MTQHDDNLDLPPELRKSLSDMYTGPGFPTGHDAAILAAAKRQARWPWRAIVSGSIAAAVAIAATLFVLQRDRQAAEPSMTHEAQAAADVAYVRTGDIRDAFFVARQIKAKKALEANWDTNGDGVVDEKDVQALAMAAVKITDGSDTSQGGVTR